MGKGRLSLLKRWPKGPKSKKLLKKRHSKRKWKSMTRKWMLRKRSRGKRKS